jgi:hypothetical protein
MKHEAVSLQVGELCRRIGVPNRHARYVLEQGIVPPGVEATPDRGNHRLLDGAQAFWLAIVLKLKQSGVTAPWAGRIAQFAQETMAVSISRLTWDSAFDPFGGRLITNRRWYLDIGDLRYGRIATDANPRSPDLFEFSWVLLGRAAEERYNSKIEVDPVVTLRLNLSQLAGLICCRQPSRPLLK